MHLKGRNNFSIPSVNTMGEVVKVKTEENNKSKIKRKAILVPKIKPSSVILKIFQEKTMFSPGAVNIWITIVIKMIIQIGFKDLNTKPTGNLATATTRAAKPIKIP